MTAWTRSRRPSFISTQPTWVFTVASPTYSSAPISALLRPWPMSWSTSCSRGGGRARSGGGGGARRLDAGTGARRGKQGLPGRPHPHGVDQIVPAHVLQQEAAGPGPQRGVDVLVEVEGGEDHDLDRVGHAGPGQH